MTIGKWLLLIALGIIVAVIAFIIYHMFVMRRQLVSCNRFIVSTDSLLRRLFEGSSQDESTRQHSAQQQSTQQPLSKASVKVVEEKKISDEDLDRELNAELNSDKVIEQCETKELLPITIEESPPKPDVDSPLKSVEEKQNENIINSLHKATTLPPIDCEDEFCLTTDA